MARPILFIGDSVTDCDRNREQFDGLGNGFVKLIDESKLFSDPVLNRGISGDRIGNLEDRWQSDVLELRPQVLSILIGVNDTWRRYDDNDPTSAEDFTTRYRNLIIRTQSTLDFKLYLCQPFILPVREEMKEWLGDLNEKIQGIKSLAQEFDATYVPFGDYFNSMIAELGMEGLAEDGIHPTELGHELMAKFWLQNFDK